MSVLSIIQQHCKLHALSVPTGVIGSTNTTVTQLQAILEEVLSEVVTESKFNVVVRESTFTTTASVDQGAMTTLAPYGYQWAIFETFFDRTLGRPLYGPLDETEWQEIQALPNPGPFYKFRIRGDRLLMNPVPAAPFSDVAFEYVSSWAVTSAGGTPQAGILADTDLFVFPENMLARGLSYRWKQIKGLPYQADEGKYYDLMNKYIARDKVKRRINVADPYPTDIRPGVFVPTGNWSV
jgi:hypothetical protein